MEDTFTEDVRQMRHWQKAYYHALKWDGDKKRAHDMSRYYEGKVDQALKKLAEHDSLFAVEDSTSHA